MKNAASVYPYRWHAIYTKSRAEKKVCDNLLRRGIEAYLPLRRVRRQWSDRQRTIEEPLLPGYLFVRVSMEEYYSVLNTAGVLSYICFEDKAASFPESQILDLKRFVAMQDTVEVTSDYITKGDYVRVVAGSLMDVCGEVVEIHGKSRLLLRFSGLGYFVHVELGVNRVEVLEQKNVRKEDVIGSKRSMKDKVQGG